MGIATSKRKKRDLFNLFQHCYDIYIYISLSPPLSPFVFYIMNIIPCYRYNTYVCIYIYITPNGDHAHTYIYHEA